MIDNPAYDVGCFCTLVVSVVQLCYFVVRNSSKNQYQLVDENDIEFILQMCCNFCNSSLVQ